MAYATKNHAKFLILYHLIFVGKYRKKLLAPLGEEVKAIFFAISTSSHFFFEEMEVDQHHIHCLAQSEPPLSFVHRAPPEAGIYLRPLAKIRIGTLAAFLERMHLLE